MNSSVSCSLMLVLGHAEYTTDFVPDMASAVREVEELLQYKFKRVSLLEQALTHSSFTHSTSYERLEFVGDAALYLAVANFLFLRYPNLDPGELTRLRIVNVSTERLARVALKRRLHRYVRHSLPADNALHQNVRDFTAAVKLEDETVLFGGEIKPPKILADIVESVVGAVYIDCGFDLEVSWPIFERLLEPLVILDSVTKLLELCKTDGKNVYIRQFIDEGNNISIASVFVDGKFIASASSKHWENARIDAAKNAFEELSYKATATKPLSQHVEPTKELCHSDDHKIGSGKEYLIHELYGCGEIECAKQKLHELCEKRKWSKPMYKTEQKTGLGHDPRFKCSVRIETGSPTELLAMGDEKSRMKQAENSAASMMLMLLGLQESE